MNPGMGCGVPPVVRVDKQGRILPNKEDDSHKSMMGMVQKTMMLEQELALLKKQKQDEVAEKGEKAEAKEVDAALGVMFNGT